MNAEPDKLPIAIRVWGLLAAPGAVWFVFRLVWEQTLLTWRNGPQMVGFSLAHTGPFLPLIGSVLLLFLWFLYVTIRTIWFVFRRRRIPALRWMVLAGTGLVFALLFAPYGFWQRLGGATIAKGPHAAEFLTFAASTGDLSTVKALLQNGASINAVNSDGSTAVYGAAVEGQLRVIEFLLLHGADLNITNRFGNTALHAAREMHRDAAEHFLLQHGAK